MGVRLAKPYVITDDNPAHYTLIGKGNCAGCKNQGCCGSKVFVR